MVLLILFSFLLRFYRLAEPANLIFDEEIYVGGFDFSKSHHPPLGYLVFGISTKIFGDCPLGWRLPSVLAGTLLIPLVYVLALRLFRSKSTALVSSFLLSFESLIFIHSRLATIDILVTFFILASFCSFFTTLHILKFTSLFLGLALSTKWSAVFAWMAILILVMVRDRRLVLPFFFLPILVYLAVFFVCVPELSKFIRWHQQTFLFHARTQEGFNLKLASPFWSWPILFSPATYFRVEKFSPSGQFTQVINAVGNMPLFWALLPSFAFLVWEGFCRWRKGKLSMIRYSLFIIHSSLWLPWAFSPRPTFLYYFLPAIPFGCIAIAHCLERVWQKPQLRPFVTGYLSLVIGFFVLLYPTFSAFPIPGWVFTLVSNLNFGW